MDTTCCVCSVDDCSSVGLSFHMASSTSRQGRTEIMPASVHSADAHDKPEQNHRVRWISRKPLAVVSGQVRQTALPYGRKKSAKYTL